MGVSPVACGFPVRVTLLDFLPWHRLIAHSLYKQYLQSPSEPLTTVTSSELLDCSFFSPKSYLLMSQEIDSTSFGFTGWGFGCLSGFYAQLPSKLKAHIMPPTRIGNQMKNVYLILVPEVLCLLQNYSPTTWAEDLVSARSLPGSNPVLPQNLLWIQIVVLDIAIRLQIRESVEKLDYDESKHDPEHEGSTQRLIDSLDANTFTSQALLDLLNEGRWATSEAKVLLGIVRSWKPSALSDLSKIPGGNGKVNAAQPDQEKSDFMNYSTYIPEAKYGVSALLSCNPMAIYANNYEQKQDQTTIDSSIRGTFTIQNAPRPSRSNRKKTKQHGNLIEQWDLRSSLMENVDIDFGNDTRNELEYERLAILLKLRGLVLIAYLMVGTDSSDVFLSESEEVQMPIV